MPEEVLKEYLLRIQMYHCLGTSGPLGPVGLVDLVRACGYERTFGSKTASPWRSTKKGTPIEASYSGQWVPGVFHGVTNQGALAIQLEGESEVKEVMAHVVRQKEPALAG